MKMKNLGKISKCTKSYSHDDDRNQHALLELINIGMFQSSFTYIIMKTKRTFHRHQPQYLPIYITYRMNVLIEQDSHIVYA